MIAHRNFVFPIICLVFISLIGNSYSQFNDKVEQETLQNKKSFYNRVLNSQAENENLEIIIKNSELFLFTKNDIPELSNILTINSKYHFTGCNNIFIFSFIYDIILKDKF
jgi:hypothetical protein